MQFLITSLKALSIIALLTTLLPDSALSQSGRSRPKVPQPSPTTTTTPPQPVNVPATAAVTRQEQVGTTSRFVLRNGITLVISEHHATPIVASVAYFKATATDGAWPMSGAAQLIERMILKGTILRPADRAVADLRALGAFIETSSSFDGTTYSVVSPSDKITDALTVQADMLQNSAFEAGALEREIPLLIEEQKHAGIPSSSWPTLRSHSFTTRTLSPYAGQQRPLRLEAFEDPAALSLTRLFIIAFTDELSGNIDALRSLSREKVVEFYRAHYRPENLIVVVTGDVSTFSTLVEIQQLYGDFGVVPAPGAEQTRDAEATKTKATGRAPAITSDNKSQTAIPGPQSSTGKPTSVKAWPPAEQGKLRYSADRADITQSIVSLGFHMPGSDSKDGPATEVLAAIAGEGRASRLSRSLIDGQAVANRIEAGYVPFVGAGLLGIQVWSATNAREGSSIDKVESALFKEVNRLRRELATEGEIARARTVLEKKFVDETTLYLGRATAMARAEAAGAGFRAVLDYRARIRAVTAEEVQRVAAKYLTLNNTTIHELEPFSASPRTFDADTYSKTVTAWSPGFSQPVDAAVSAVDATTVIAPVPQGSERTPERQAIVESVEPVPVKDFSTLNGPRAFVREDHAQQAVTIAILFQGGRLVEESATSGTTELMLRSILYGTSRRAYSQLTQELEQLGADVRLVVEPDYFGYMLSALSRNADRALKLLRDAIEEPAFRDDDIVKARLGQISEIRDARDSSFMRSRELLLQAVFPGHSYSLPSHGREEVVAALTAEKLIEWHSRVIKRQLPTAIIVGDTDGSALVSSQIAEGFKRRDVDSAIQVRTPQRAPTGEKIEQRRNDETKIGVGFAGPKAESVDLPAIELIESAMNGAGGRLHRELLSKQNLASTGWMEHQSMFLGGVISAHASTRVENETQTRNALLAEFERLARNGLTAEEITSARTLVTTSSIALLQSQPQHAFQYAQTIFYRKQASDVDNLREQVSKVTAEDIKRMAAAYLKVSGSYAGIVRGTPQQPAQPSKQD